MKKETKDLVGDIKELFDSGKLPAGYKVEYFIDFAAEVGRHVARSVEPEDRPKRDDQTIYASELGTDCYRQLAYKIYKPEAAEPLHYSVKMKFLYGHILEALTLLLAKLAGHEVTNEQEVVEATTPLGNRIRGRIDAILNGDTVVDVKSTSPTAFDKMTKNKLWEDSFGYRYQLDYYQQHISSTYVKPPKFLLVNKVSGEMAAIPNRSDIPVSTNYPVVADILLGHVQRNKLNSTKLSDEPHPKGRVLPLKCSYCSYKFDCWKGSNGGRGLRIFRYSRGPLFFTRVDSGETAFLAKEITIKDALKKEEEVRDEVAGVTPEETPT